jgi:hypothetical protein
MLVVLIFRPFMQTRNSEVAGPLTDGSEAWPSVEALLFNCFFHSYVIAVLVNYKKM